MNQALAELKESMTLNTLRRCQIFAGLPAEDLKQVLSVTVTRNLKKGEYLFREGDPARGFYIVQRGAVNVHRVTAAGKEQVIHIFRQGTSFAEAAVASPVGFPADARAVEPAQVLLVQKDGFVALLRHQPELALRMLASMSGHLRTLLEQIEDLTAKDVETRVAHWLLKHCPNPDAEQAAKIELSVPKRVLAAELGTVSETFSRTLAKFRTQKLIAVKGRVLTVLSPAKLKAVLRHHLGE